MKKKLRKITVNNKTFLYKFGATYLKGKNSPDTNSQTLTVYLENHKLTPLIIQFLTLDDYYLGSPLKNGIQLKNLITQEMEVVNLNRPYYVQLLISLALDKGWTGENQFSNQEGLSYLEQLGYDVSPLLPENQSTLDSKNKFLG